MCTTLAYVLNLSFFHWIGIVYFLQLIYVNLRWLYRGFVLYVWSYFSTSKDFVKDYGEWAVVTGGSDGIGKQIAYELAAKKMNIFILSNVENDLKLVSSKIEEAYGVKSEWMCVDFSETSCYEAISQRLDQISDIGVLVNNVGTINETLKKVSKQSEWDIKKMINVNCFPCAMLTRIILPRMITKKKGLILNLGSQAGKSVLPRASMYCASKAFIRKFSECIAEEVRGHGVQVSCLEPLFIATGLVLNNSEVREVVKSFPRLVMPTPKDFAKCALRVLNVRAPLFYCGYWAHGLASNLIGALGKARIERALTGLYEKRNRKTKAWRKNRDLRE